MTVFVGPRHPTTDRRLREKETAPLYVREIHTGTLQVLQWSIIIGPCACSQNIASQCLYFMMFTSFIDYNAPGKVLSPVRVYIFPVHSDLFFLAIMSLVTFCA